MAKKATKTKVASDIESAISQHSWRDSVIYLKEVDLRIVCLPPKMLKENPKNWRVHTQRQRTTFNEFKDKYGWLNFVIYNLKSELLLDGHMRVDEAIKRGDNFVPVVLAYQDEQGENEILSTFDPIGLLAQHNNAALESLIKSTNQENVSKVKNANQQRLQQMRNDLSALAKNDGPSVLLPQSKTKVRVVEDIPEDTDDDEDLPDSFQPNREQLAVVSTIDPNVIFDGSTHIGVPTFLPERICTPDKAPTKTYIGKEDSRKHYYCYSQSDIHDGLKVGTIGFYVDDFKFDTVYNNPDDFLAWAMDIDPVALITPDFSSYTSWPLIKNLWALYRNRWVGRIWQEAGFDIIPTVQILDKSYKQSITYSLETLPRRCPTVAIECRNGGSRDMSNVVEWIKTIVDVVKPDCFILYGGEEKQKLIHGDIPKAFKAGKTSVKVDYRFLPLVVTEKKRSKKRG